jgi:GntR family transcriptional regulator of arabinose operon
MQREKCAQTLAQRVKLLYQTSSFMSEPASQPKHQRVFDELHREIVSGKYADGQKLPSEADLVKRFGTSRITVGRAVRDLKIEGLVERRAGSGTYARFPKSGANSNGFSFGLLIPDLGRTEIFEPICQGMADSSQAGEHALLWFNATTRDRAAPTPELVTQICRQIIARSVSGVFFAPFEALRPEDRTNERIVEALDNARIPIVLLDRDILLYPRRSGHDLAGIDNRRAGYIATEHLIRLGSRRIAFLAFPRTAATVDERIAGYREALYMNGLPVEAALVQRLMSEDDESIRRIMNEVKPDAFVCATDRTAGRLMHSLIALNVRAPDEVRIVGIDDIPYASLLPVPLTTVHQPCHEIGRAAMAAMLGRIERPAMPARDVLLETTLVVRESCGAKRQAGNF